VYTTSEQQLKRPAIGLATQVATTDSYFYVDLWQTSETKVDTWHGKETTILAQVAVRDGTAQVR
jgi:hypothetical protein